MPKKSKKAELKFIETIPDLEPEERDRRIENFVDTFAKAVHIEGYVGCKYDSRKGKGQIFTK